MKDLTITQEYMICALNEKGKMSEMLGVEKIVCFVASGLLEMKLEGCIAMEKKKVCVISDLPEKLAHLKPLYDYINRYESVKIEKIIEEYTYTFTDKRFYELVDSVGKSLAEINMAEEIEKGILGKRKYYIPTDRYDPVRASGGGRNYRRYCSSDNSSCERENYKEIFFRIRAEGNQVPAERNFKFCGRTHGTGNDRSYREYDEYDDSAYGVIQLNDLSIHERYVNVWFFYADGG